MQDQPYARFLDGELILRDELAIDRTLLANERTVLAYLRGGMTLAIAGVTFLHFVETGLLPYLGVAFIPGGIAVGAFGWWRYRRMDRAIRLVREATLRHGSGGAVSE